MSRTKKQRGDDGKGAGGGTRRIEVFRPGTFTALNGQAVTYTPRDVAAGFAPPCTHPLRETPVLLLPSDTAAMAHRRKDARTPLRSAGPRGGGDPG
ncbi:MAG TPA: hypothetical protein ENK13_04720 [Thermopetrobacter sp.]|nr:hypothetical protein [Thermopetrobacter sp.]